MRNRIVEMLCEGADPQLAARAQGLVGADGNLAAQLVSVGFAPDAVLEACASATGLLAAPVAWRVDPRPASNVSDDVAAACRRLGVAPVASGNGLTLAFGDPELAARRESLSLPPHAAWIALPLDVERALERFAASAAPPPPSAAELSWANLVDGFDSPDPSDAPAASAAPSPPALGSEPPPPAETASAPLGPAADSVASSDAAEPEPETRAVAFDALHGLHLILEEANAPLPEPHQGPLSSAPLASTSVASAPLPPGPLAPEPLAPLPPQEPTPLPRPPEPSTQALMLEALHGLAFTGAPAASPPVEPAPQAPFPVAAAAPLPPAAEPSAPLVSDDDEEDEPATTTFSIDKVRAAASALDLGDALEDEAEEPRTMAVRAPSLAGLAPPEPPAPPHGLEPPALEPPEEDSPEPQTVMLTLPVEAGSNIKLEEHPGDTAAPPSSTSVVNALFALHQLARDEEEGAEAPLVEVEEADALDSFDEPEGDAIAVESDPPAASGAEAPAGDPSTALAALFEAAAADDDGVALASPPAHAGKAAGARDVLEASPPAKGADEGLLPRRREASEGSLPRRRSEPAAEGVLPKRRSEPAAESSLPRARPGLSESSLPQRRRPEGPVGGLPRRRSEEVPQTAAASSPVESSLPRRRPEGAAAEPESSLPKKRPEPAAVESSRPSMRLELDPTLLESAIGGKSVGLPGASGPLPRNRTPEPSGPVRRADGPRARSEPGQPPRAGGALDPFVEGARKPPSAAGEPSGKNPRDRARPLTNPKLAVLDEEQAVAKPRGPAVSWPIAFLMVGALAIAAMALFRPKPQQQDGPVLPPIEEPGKMDGSFDVATRQLQLVRAGMAEREHKNAIEKFTSAILLNPTSAGSRDAYLERAKRQIQIGQLRAAEEDLMRLKKRSDFRPISKEVEDLLNRIKELKRQR